MYDVLLAVKMGRYGSGAWSQVIVSKLYELMLREIPSPLFLLIWTGQSDDLRPLEFECLKCRYQRYPPINPNFSTLLLTRIK